MLKHLKEYGKYLEITGFRNVQLADAEDFLKTARKKMPQHTELQLFNSDLVASWQHLYFAVLNSLMAFRNRRNISKSVAVEVMLYASSQRQIKKAIEFVGVKKDSANVAAVIISSKVESAKTGLAIISDCFSVEADETVLELSVQKVQRIRIAFDISDLELETTTADNIEEALVDVVIERVALLSTQI
ncbi:MAG TPA: KEOPS complex subunit Cgi121 [Candidatus Bathyarchaeia archaeon]|nr:KEOPS complex subunit Cgi121 [Candidatus Bathyarchaeia archaeon]